MHVGSFRTLKEAKARRDFVAGELAPARELAERAGHSRPSMSLDVYSHVMPPDEVPCDRFQALLTARR